MEFNSKKYWNLSHVLSFQRHFNFINSSRKNGKTYTYQGYIIKRAKENNEQFMYHVRTEKQIQAGAFEKAFEKVLKEQYPNLIIKFDKTEAWLCDNDGKRERVVGFCRSLGGTTKMKIESFPNVRWGMFDEYMLLPQNFREYVTGWNEPNLLLNQYDTIDRAENRYILFCFGNNTAFFNPYHMHPAFNIPECKEGEIWTSKNVLFQRAKMSDELKKEIEESDFGLMVEGTKYGDYAIQGEYIGDEPDFIAERPNKCVFVFSFRYDDELYGVWHEPKTGRLFVSQKLNKQKLPIFAVDTPFVRQGEIRARREHSTMKWFGKRLNASLVYYETMEIKMKTIEAFRKVIF